LVNCSNHKSNKILLNRYYEKIKVKILKSDYDQNQ